MASATAELAAAYAIRVHKDRMQQELDVGRDIQLSMIPLDFSTSPEHDDVSLFARLQPAREVSGDFYDFHFVGEERLFLCIGDVSDKGVPAALFMAVTKTLIRSRSTDDLSPGSILTHVNDELSRDNAQCMFVTLFAGVLDLRTGSWSTATPDTTHRMSCGTADPWKRWATVTVRSRGRNGNLVQRVARGATARRRAAGIHGRCHRGDGRPGRALSQRRLADLVQAAPSLPHASL